MEDKNDFKEVTVCISLPLWKRILLIFLLIFMAFTISFGLLYVSHELASIGTKGAMKMLTPSDLH